MYIQVLVEWFGACNIVDFEDLLDLQKVSGCLDQIIFLLVLDIDTQIIRQNACITIFCFLKRYLYVAILDSIILDLFKGWNLERLPKAVSDELLD